MMKTFSFGKRSMARLVGVHPILAFAALEAIKISKIDFGVVSGIRSIKEQRELVKNGFSKTFNSYHLYGLAIDLVPFIDGNYRWDNEEAFEEIYLAMKTIINKHSLPIDNGFDLWNWDKPHWQMTGFRKKYDIRKIYTRKECVWEKR